MPRAVAILLLALVAGGCRREPRFDDRYNETARNIEQRAGALDVELNRASSAPHEKTGLRNDMQQPD